MRTGIRILGPMALLVLVAVMVSGCEDTDLTAPIDGAVVMRANPSTMVIDPNTQQPNPNTLQFEAVSAIEALLVNFDGQPLEGVSVFFSTTAGTLASAGQPGSPATPVTTDASGLARDVLTVTNLDPATVTVTAQSAALFGTVDLALIVVGGNQLPQASIGFVPRNDDNLDTIPDGPVTEIITFDGANSLDPDGTITCYQWSLLSDNPAAGQPNPIVIQGAGASGLQGIFADEQTLAIDLVVGDDTNLTCTACGNLLTFTSCNPADVVPLAQLSPLADRRQYQIVCQNRQPTGVIAGSDPINATIIGTTANVVLDGTLSFDAETQIDRYVWSCGNNLPPVDVSGPQDGSIVRCSYLAGNFTATLQVVDRGTGVSNPATGTFFCQKFSEQDQVTVNVQ